MTGDITDFSSKDSKEYNTSMMLFAESGDVADKELSSFQETLYCQESIPTQLRRKSHNSKHFLDEDYLIGKKMNADTSAIKELTEELKYGSTEEDLDAEITDGGVAAEIAGVLANHGITGKAVKDTFTKVENFFGKDPDTSELAGGSTEDVEADTEDDFDETSEEETEEPVEDEEPEPVEESLEEKLALTSKMLKRKVAEKALRKASGTSLKESEDDDEDFDDDFDDFDDEERFYDWYEDADDFPLNSAYKAACDQLGIWPQHSVQAGEGMVEFLSIGDDEVLFTIDFGDECEFMNSLCEEFLSNVCTEEDCITAIKDFLDR